MLKGTGCIPKVHTPLKKEKLVKTILCSKLLLRELVTILYPEAIVIKKTIHSFKKQEFMKTHSSIMTSIMTRILLQTWKKG